MKFLVLFFLSTISLASTGIIHDESDDEGSNNVHSLSQSHHHEDDRPTSYQSIHIKHYHPVPVYIKKEHKHLLDHPISSGDSSSQLEVHHGGKYDHGYAIANNDQQELNGYGGEQVEGGHQYENSESVQSQEDDFGDNYGGHSYGGQFQTGGEEGHYQSDGESSEEGNEGGHGYGHY